MTEHRGNRFQRSEDARFAILWAADDLLAEIGFGAMTIEMLATRAGVSKQTIYRWWPSKADVLLETLRMDAEKRITVPDLGSAVDEIPTAVNLLTAFLDTDDAGRVLLALRAHARLDRGFAETWSATFAPEQLVREEAPLRRAIERGELAADTDIPTAWAALYGPLYLRAESGEIGAAFANTITAGWLAAHGIGTTGRG